MSKLEELQQTATDLQTALDAKQEQIAAKIAADTQTIADLQAIIDSGGGATEAQLQTVIDSLTASKSDLEGTPTV